MNAICTHKITMCMLVAFFGLFIVPASGDAMDEETAPNYESDWDEYDDLIVWARFRMNLGIRAVSAGNFDEGIAELTGAFRTVDQADALLLYLDDYAEVGFDVGYDELARAYLMRAIAYFAKGDTANAFKDAVVSLGHEPTADAQMLMATCQIADGNKADALMYYRVLRGNYPDKTAFAQNVRENYFKVFGEPISE
jgi:tetratricopeptide (TPR) repeat protein